MTSRVTVRFRRVDKALKFHKSGFRCYDAFVLLTTDTEVLEAITYTIYGGSPNSNKLPCDMDIETEIGYGGPVGPIDNYTAAVQYARNHLTTRINHYQDEEDQ